ncbi:MAG: serine acetyltransferase [Limnothrix sp. RL_2_0]|nr:serine acetyltransferase [Limnothrix sp. RL_2_0]
MLMCLREDLDRYMLLDERAWWVIILTCQGVWVTAQYRFSRWVKCDCHVPVIRQVLRLFCAISQRVVVMLTNCEFPNTAQIGKGLLIPHPYGIVIHQDAQIGDYCNLGQDTTIGIGGRKEKSGVPILGDRIFVGPGARIFGKISIANDVAIGANAVVTKSLEANAVAVGIPAKVISYKGSQDFIIYRQQK